MKSVCSFFIIICCAFCNAVEAQLFRDSGTRSQALGGVKASLSDSWSVLGNQAGMAYADTGIQAGIYYSNLFLLKELSQQNAFCSVRWEKSVFACSLYRYGELSYHETKWGLAYAQKVFPDFSAGFQFNYCSIYFPENDRSFGTFCFEGGIQYRLDDHFLLGACVFNPWQAFIEAGSVKYKLPATINTGLGWSVDPHLKCFFELEKNMDEPLCSMFALEFLAGKNILFRGGLATKPGKWSGGVAYPVGKLMVDVACSYTPRLGCTPSVSFTYSLK